MKLLVLLTYVLFAAKSYASVCQAQYTISGTEAVVDFFLLEPGVPLKICLKLPKVDPNDPKNAGRNPFVEFQTINLSRSSCSDVKMVVNPPGVAAPKGYSNGPQPGVVLPYKGGQWAVKYTLKDGCTKYSASARWSLVP